MTEIVWIASYPKSGNTWLRAFLGSLLDGGSLGLDDLATTVASQRDLFDEFAGFSSSYLTSDEADRVRPDIYRAWCMSSHERVFCKVHDACCDAGGRSVLPEQCPQRAVYVLRNPLDVAISFAHHAGVSLDTAIDWMGDDAFTLSKGERTPSRQLAQKLGSWSHHVETWTRTRRLPVLVIRYEDMIADAIGTFGCVVRFLGYEPDTAGLARAVENTSFGRLREQEETRGFAERSSRARAFFRRGRPGEWQDVLSSAQVQRIHAAHRRVMAEFGYLRP